MASEKDNRIYREIAERFESRTVFESLDEIAEQMLRKSGAESGFGSELEGKAGGEPSTESLLHDPVAFFRERRPELFADYNAVYGRMKPTSIAQEAAASNNGVRFMLFDESGTEHGIVERRTDPSSSTITLINRSDHNLEIAVERTPGELPTGIRSWSKRLRPGQSTTIEIDPSIPLEQLKPVLDRVDDTT